MKSSQIIGVVDDDPRIRLLLEEELEEIGYEVRSYADGFEFLKDVKASKQPDLLLLDLMLPQIDGIEVLKSAREEGYTAPILIFTALSDNKKRLEAERYNANDYLLKPDLFDNLERVISKHLPKDS